MTEIRVEYSDLELDGAGVCRLYQGVLFTGIAVDRWPGGELRTETTFEEGYPDGPEREWYASGQMAAERTFYAGGAHGVSREWTEDGRLKSEATFEYTVLVSRRVYDLEGRIIDDYVLRETDPQFELLRQRRKFAEHP
jgi:antitoxin component YwqK of YwqJK toxin-antitoxin module